MALPKRFQVQSLGEEYHSQLAVEAWLKDRSIPAEAASLLCAKLMQRQEKRRAMVTRIAQRRGITTNELIDQIYAGTAEHLSPGDMADLQAESDE